MTDPHENRELPDPSAVQGNGPSDGPRPPKSAPGSHEPRSGEESDRNHPDAPLSEDEVARLAEFVTMLDEWDRNCKRNSVRRSA